MLGEIEDKYKQPILRPNQNPQHLFGIFCAMLRKLSSEGENLPAGSCLPHTKSAQKSVCVSDSDSV